MTKKGTTPLPASIEEMDEQNFKKVNDNDINYITRIAYEVCKASILFADTIPKRNAALKQLVLFMKCLPSKYSKYAEDNILDGKDSDEDDETIKNEWKEFKEKDGV